MSEETSSDPMSEETSGDPMSEETSGNSMSEETTDRLIEKLSGYLSGESSSRWNLITEEELFSGTRRRNRIVGGTNVPDQIEELLQMTEEYQVTDEGRAEAFLKQARFMESYDAESDGYDGAFQRPYAEYHHLYIGYQEMSLQELMEYFRWRTCVRRKEKTSYSYGFALLYASEIICLSDDKNRAETFETLLKLQAVVQRQIEERKSRGLRVSSSEEQKLRKTIHDYVIISLEDPDILLEYGVEDKAREADNVTLCYVDSSNDFSVYNTLTHFVEHRVLNSKFLQQTGEDAWRVIARAFRRFCTLQKSKGGTSLAEKILGSPKNRIMPFYQMLPCLVPYKEGYCAAVSPVTSYYCENGKWHSRAYSALRDETALRELGEFVRECERVLRKKLHFKNQLPNRMKDPAIEAMIAQETDRWLEEKKLRNRPEVHVDLSKLSAIRSLADITRDRLLEGTQEGEEAELAGAMNVAVDTAQTASAMNAAADTTQTAGAMNATAGITQTAGVMNAAADTAQTARAFDGADNIDTAGAAGSGDMADAVGTAEMSNAAETAAISGIFNDDECVFLRILLDGGNGADYFKTHAVIPSVFVDAINEKAYDEIGDSIVEEDGRTWCLVEDYEEDVRAMLGE